VVLVADGTAVLTPGEAVARARALVPVLAERATKAEALRRMPDETIADLVSSGLLRITQPRRFGGSELPLPVTFDVTNLLSQGCGSTGWTYSLLASHNWFMAQFEDRVQQEVWGPNPDAIMSTSFSGGGPPEAVDGGLHIVEGRWRYSTGVHHADWVALLAPVLGEDGTPDPRFLLIPKGEVEIIEDWRSPGLAGSGSCSVLARDVFVPHYRTVRLQDMLDATAPGRLVNDGPLYQFPIVGAWDSFISGPAPGVARGAMDAWIARTKGRRHPFTGVPVSAEPPGLIRLGDAAARIDAAETLIRGITERATSDVLTYGAIKPETRVRNRRDSVFGVRLCVEAVEELFLAAGAGSLDESSPLQRHWRDVHAVAQHIANNRDLSFRAWGEYALGLSDGLSFG
jgi:alkylation response protein AidB-like acyl-CoA dehydrogenase